MAKTQSYHVSVARQDLTHGRATSRQHTLTLNIERGGTAAGFNAAETLLASLGTCMLTNVNTYIEKMHMDVKSVRIDLEAKRQSDPPVITEIHYKLVFDSPEPKNRLETLHDLSLRYGTVVNTVINGIQPQGTITTKQEDDDAASS